MADSATLTLVTGPAVTMTAGVINDVNRIDFNVAGEVLFVTSGSTIKQFALSGSNTITLTASGGNYTLTIT